jgi:hypothetical protein
MQATYINPNPQVYEVTDISRMDGEDSDEEDPLDSLEVFGTSSS